MVFEEEDKMQIKYSVIIPVYNAEKTLKRCLDSLLGQKRQDIEIILINDGSSDRSGEIIDEYRRKYGSIVSLEQENSGVSAARNRGLNAATGTYILCVDSDDYVSEDYFNVIDEAGEKEDSDLIVFANEKDGRKAEDFSKLYSSIMDCSRNLDKIKVLIASRIIFEPSFKRFKRTLIETKNLRFIEHMQIGEDFNFCLAYIIDCKTISAIDRVIYYFDISGNDSLSRKYRPNIGDELLWQFKEIFATIDTSGLTMYERNELKKIAGYFTQRSVFTCITETFKTGKIKYWKNRSYYREVCRKFGDTCFQYTGYYSIIHLVLSFLIKHRLVMLLYGLARIAKGRQFSRYTEDGDT